MKKGWKITGMILAVLLLVLLGGVIAVQSPRVQTFLVHRALDRLRGSIDGEISVGRISVEPMDAVYLEDILIRDNAPFSDGTLPPVDTLAYIGRLATRFSLGGLLNGQGIHLMTAQVSELHFHLVTEPDPESPKGSTTNLARVFRLSQDSRSKFEWGSLLSARRADVESLHFSMVSYTAMRRHAAEGRAPLPPEVTDWSNMSLTGNVHVRDLKIADSHIRGEVTRMSLTESRGLHFDEITGKVSVGKQRVDIRNLHIVDAPRTDLSLKYFRMLGSIREYGDFLDRIRLEADIRKPSVLSMQTIRHFGRGMSKFNFRPELSGRFEGYVSDFTVKNLQFRDTESGVGGTVDGGMIGLPEIGSTLLDYRVKDLRFSLDGLGKFVRGWAPRAKLDLKKMAPGETFSFSGSARGPLNRLGVRGNLHSNVGGATADVTLRNLIDRQRPIIIGGSLATDNVDAGKIAGIDAIHEVTLHTGLETTLGKDGLSVRLDSLHIDRLNALGYDYSDISAVGTYSDKAFDGRLVCNDPNLNFLFQGLFNFSPRTRNAAYQFYASLGYADLHALHLDKRERSKLAFQTSANFIRTEEKDLLGEIEVMDLNLESDTGHHDIGAIQISAHANDDIHRIRFHSGFADGSFVGDKSIFAMVSDLKDLLIREELSALAEGERKPWDGSRYELNFTFHDSRDLLDFIAPGAYIEKNSAIRLKVSEAGLMDASVTSGRLAYAGKFFKDLSLKANNAEQALRANLTSSLLHLGGIELKGNRASLFADNNHIGIGYTYDNETEAANRGEIYLSGEMERIGGKLSLRAEALPSNIYYEGEGWSLQCREARLLEGNLTVDGMRAQSNDQVVAVWGGYSPEKRDTLHLSLEKFDISLLNTLTGGRPALEGRASGRARIVSPAKGMPGILAGVVCDSTYVAGRRAGSVRLGSVWNEEKKQFDFSLANSLDGRRNMDIRGNLSPSTRELAARAVLDSMDLGYISPFLEGIFDRFEAALDGTVRVSGKLDKLHLSSENARIRNGLLQVEFTQVPYRVEGPVEINDQGLFFRGVSLSDGLGGSGSVSGGILMQQLKDFRMDTHLNFEKMKVLGIRSSKDTPIYGDVYGSGRVDITGPFSQLLLDIDARTAGDGNLHIPLGSSSSARIRNILTFKEPVVQREVDPYELLTAESPKKVQRRSKLGLKLKVRATPDVMAYIDVGEGNSLSGVGSGLIEIESNLSEGGLTMGGDYTLSEGNFHFSALNLVSRDFAIQEGSSVRFNGDVMSTDLDVNGLYTTKTSLSNLLSDSTSVSRRTVNCGIHITDKLRNPQISFSIDIPDLDPATQYAVESALNTEDKIQKQFLYLLITNSFLPVEESGITTGGSSMLYSNVTSIMAGQLNNIFQKLDIPLDLGLNYEPNTSGGRDLFDVAVSTQLFNNRVMVNGTIGSRRYGATTNGEVTGDLDIEVKLDKPGTFRLNLFSHSADQYSSFLDYSQRNGIGIAYQREFAKPPSGQKVLEIDSTGRAIPLNDDELR